MKRLIAVAAAASTLSCASAMQMAQSASSGDAFGIADSATHLAVEGKDLHDALARCDALRDVAVSYQEERSIGGAIAVGAVAKMGGLWIDATHDDATQDLEHPESFDQFKKDAPLNRLTRAVARVGAMLGARSSRPDIFWTFAVLKDEHVNAFSAPGGYVFVSRGLLEQITDENQLAGVLAHEITHVTERHGVKAYLDMKVDACKKAIYIEKGSGEAKALAEQFVSSLGFSSDQYVRLFEGLLSSSGHILDFDDAATRPLLKKLADEVTNRLEAGYARDQELEADRGAVELSQDAGYDPQAFIDLVAKLPSSDSYLSHHPPAEQRVEAMKDEEAKLASNPFIDRSKLRKAVALNQDITAVMGKMAAGDAP